jgi:hypothetical protein
MTEADLVFDPGEPEGFAKRKVAVAITAYEGPLPLWRGEPYADMPSPFRLRRSEPACGAAMSRPHSVSAT